MGYELYYSPGACSMAAHIVLEELGQPVALTLVSARDGSAQKPDYLRINPKGRVPALRLSGEPRVLTELPAILTYLATAHRAPALLPVEPLAQGRVQEWLGWLAGWLHGTGYGLLWRPERFSDDQALMSALPARGLSVVDTANRDVERQLSAAGPWALGDAYSIVDPFLLVLYFWGGLVGLDMRQHPAWTAHCARMVERPAVIRALEREGVTISV